MKFLRRIATISPLFCNWHSLYQSGVMYRPMRIKKPDVTRELERGVNHTDIDRAPIPELGYSVYLCNMGAAGAEVNVHIQCGVYTPWVFNAVSVSQPYLSRKEQWKCDTSVLDKLVNAMAECWRPDYGGVDSADLWDVVQQPREHPTIGWINYLSNKYGPLPSFPKPIEVEPAKGGHIIWATREPFSSKKKKHVDAVRAIIDAMNWPERLARLEGAKGEAKDDVVEIVRVPRSKGRGKPKVIRVKVKKSPPGKPLRGDQRPMLLNLKRKPTPRNAARFAADIVTAARDISGAKLDYSVKSLRKVDFIIEGFRKDGCTSDQIGETLFGFGCYVGEVFVRQAAGAWRATSKTPMAGHSAAPFVVELPNETFCNPIDKVFKRLENGEPDNLPYFYSQFAETAPPKRAKR